MVLNKYFILGIICFFLIFFGVIIFWDSKNDGSSEDEKEIVWIEKPSFMLLKDLKSKNPVQRREAIIKLGEKRVKHAVQPLFEIMFSNNPLHEKQLAAKSVALITEGEIIPFCLKILNQYKNEPSNEIVFSMVSILKNINVVGKNLSQYDFSIIETLLNQSKDNSLIISLIEAIENLKYAKAFITLRELYNKNFFYKINILKALTQLALEKKEQAEWLKNFLNKTIWEESHDDIKKTIREAFFVLSFNRKPDRKESALIGLISDLTSSSYKKVFDAEAQLLEYSFEEKDLVVTNFFFKDVDPVILSRLTGILAEKNILELRADFIEIIQNRYGASRNREATLDSAKKAIKGLAKITKNPEDVNFIAGFLQDAVMSDSAFEAFEILVARKFEKDAIDKKIAGIAFYTLPGSKTPLFPFMNLNFALNEAGRIEKMIQSGDGYVRYNALNQYLGNRNGQMSDSLEWIKKTNDEIINSILKRYKII